MPGYMEDRHLYVVLRRGALPDEVRAVEEVFHRAGIEATAEPGVIDLTDVDLVPYLVVLTAPIAWIGAQFLGGAANAAGADTWAAFRDGGWKGIGRFVREIARAHGPERTGSVTIEEPDGPRVTLASHLPEEAFQALGELDWSEMTGGWLGWGESGEEWLHVAPGATEPQPAPHLPLARAKTRNP